MKNGRDIMLEETAFYIPDVAVDSLRAAGIYYD